MLWLTIYFWALLLVGTNKWPKKGNLFPFCSISQQYLIFPQMIHPGMHWVTKVEFCLFCHSVPTKAKILGRSNRNWNDTEVGTGRKPQSLDFWLMNTILGINRQLNKGKGHPNYFLCREAVRTLLLTERTLFRETDENSLLRTNDLRSNQSVTTCHWVTLR